MTSVANRAPRPPRRSVPTGRPDRGPESRPAPLARPGRGRRPARGSRLLPLLALLAPLAGGPVRAAQTGFLAVDDAFQVGVARVAPREARLHLVAAPGTYLYRDRIRLTTKPPAALGAVTLPAGETHADPSFGEQVVYRGTVEVPLLLTSDEAVTVRVRTQGCADAGLCYPPQTREFTLPGTGAAPATAVPSGAQATPAAPAGDESRFADVLAHGSPWALVLTFYVAGLLLSLTPCVWPMVPIVLAVIAGEGTALTPRRSVQLALSYVTGLALTYAAAGAASARLGAEVQASFQHPGVLVAVALLVVGLAGGLFGFYDLALPGRWQTRLHRAGDRLQGGKVLEVGLLGALSALVVSACVAPALVASLAFLAETGSAARGALALFVMGFGMGTPLLVLGTTEGRWLPRSGPWMELVKQLLGVGLLAVAASLVARVASPLTSRALELAVWGVLAAVLWRAARPAGRLPRWRAVAIVLVVLAAAIRGLKAPEVAPTDRIATVAAFDATLAAARAAQRPVLVVVGADWCASCHAMDREVYAHPSVRPVLAGLAVVRLDVTEPTDDVRRLEHRLGLVGPPTALFLDRDGRERRDLRLTGEAPRATVLAHLAALAGRGVSRPSG